MGNEAGKVEMSHRRIRVEWRDGNKKGEARVLKCKECG